MPKRKIAAMAQKMMAAPQIDLFFLGTASMMPSKTRNVSATGMRIGSKWWIFDVGEGTQHQTIQDDSLVNTGSISRIFITHLHGDHCFGLPGLMCKMGTDEANRVVEVVGPRGLRSLLRNTFKATYTGLHYQYIVHELWPATDEQAGGRIANEAAIEADTGTNDNLYFRELKGKNVRPGADGLWVVPSSNSDVSGFTVRAAPLSHSVPTVGYVIQEQDYPGNVDPSILKDRLKDPANIEHLKKRGINVPQRIYGILKSGESVELADGIVEPSDVLGPTKLGRKLVILGDTNDSTKIASLSHGCDVLVHEATNSFVKTLDKPLINQLQAATGVPTPGKGEEWPEPTDEVISLAKEAVFTKTLAHGHSTPEMAAEFAKVVGAKRLVLTHFSARYKSSDDDEDVAVMKTIVEQAESVLKREGCVFTAYDFWRLEIPIDTKATIPSAEAAKNAQQKCAELAASYRRRASTGRKNPILNTARDLVRARTHEPMAVESKQNSQKKSSKHR